MSKDNVIQFPRLLPDAIDKEKWHGLQAEFYLDCYSSHHGHPAEDPEQLREWLQEVQLYADMENPFFRGWLVRRLSEESD